MVIYQWSFVQRILTNSLFKYLCLVSIGHWLEAWCLFGATLFDRGYLHPTWSHWLVCASQKQPKIYRRQIHFSKNVHNKRPLSTRFRLLNIFSPKGVLNPLSWLRLTGLYVIEPLFHMLPPNDHWPTDLLYRGREWHGDAAWLRKPCTQTGAQGATADRPVGHWTRLQDSPTVASTVTRTRILLWWNLFYVSVDEHIQRSYTLTQNLLSWHIGAIGRHHELLCMYFCKWNICTDFMCECIKMLSRPFDCAIICPKRSITVSKSDF